MFTNDYGFIVDYLAEILRELRKEDYSQDYKKFFDLSDTITTRDKDSISKTFSGLVKIIYPNCDYTQEEAQELLDFAIEGRKRVKQELIKIDETFEKVDFKYKVISTGKEQVIDTLEMLEHLPNECNIVLDVKAEYISPEKENTPKKQLELQAGQKIIRDNQSGISYDLLFGAYLIGATEITLTDPYLRLPYQLRNFMEFTKLISQKKEPDTNVKLHLITSNIKEYIENSHAAFEQMEMSLESIGIEFTYEINDNIHDRSIELNNDWKIILGRGLDIWQKTGGWFDINEYVQEKRLCKACEVSFMKK